MIKNCQYCNYELEQSRTYGICERHSPLEQVVYNHYETNDLYYIIYMMDNIDIITCFKDKHHSGYVLGSCYLREFDSILRENRYTLPDFWTVGKTIKEIADKINNLKCMM